MKSLMFVFLKTIFIVFFAFSAGHTFSQTSSHPSGKADIVNKVHFMGVQDNYLLFDLRVAELPAKGCTLRIIDEAGNTMFEETLLGNYFTRRYKIAREGMQRISFKASGKGLALNQSFTIKTEEKLVVIDYSPTVRPRKNI